MAQFFKRLFTRGSKEGEPHVSSPERSTPLEPSNQTPKEARRSRQLDQDLAPKSVAPPVEQATIEFATEISYPGKDEVLKEPVDLLVVQVDDEEKYRLLLSEHKPILFRTQEKSAQTAELVQADQWEKVIVLAMKGNAGEQANVVILDHKLNPRVGKQDDWNIKPEKLRKLLAQLDLEVLEGVFDFSLRESQIQSIIDFQKHFGRTLTPDDVKRDWKEGEFPRRLFGLTNSVNIAVLLRIIGFEGKIIVMSSDPPSPKKYSETIKQTNIALDTHFPYPIDACVSKRVDDDGEFVVTNVHKQDFFQQVPDNWASSDKKIRAYNVADGLAKVISELSG